MKILDVIFPQAIKCFICKREIDDYGVCDYCYPHLPFVGGKLCTKCGGEMTGNGDICEECKNEKFYFTKNYAVFNYIDDIQKVILSFKKDNKYLGGYFSDIIRNYILKNKIKFDLIIPMPIHENRRKQRGYNQSEILVKSLEKDFAVDKDIVIRIKDTPHQTGLNKENRKINLEHAFQVKDQKKIKDKVILLVDDIYTTGSTLNECSKELLKYGAKEVIGLCVARGQSIKILDEKESL